MPDDIHAELIGGIVYMSSPQKPPHSKTTHLVSCWLGEYEEKTPGTEVLAGATDIMGVESEPEPDHCLLIVPECNGQTSLNEKGYLAGAPELIVETASTTESRDLHQKKADYERAGVLEYVVVALRSRRVFWFTLRSGEFKEVKPGVGGIFRSRVFPGLWLDPDALLNLDRRKLLHVLRRGLRSKEHEAFVAKLAARRRRNR
jgi:Uma2 family endonuclease